MAPGVWRKMSSDLPAESFQRCSVVADDAHFDRSFHDLSLLQFLDEDLGLGRDVGKAIAQCFDQLGRSLYLFRVYEDCA